MSSPEIRLKKKYEELARVDEAYQRTLLSQSWKSSDGMSERSVYNASLSALAEEKRRLEKEIDALESVVNGTNMGAIRIGVMR